MAMTIFTNGLWHCDLIKSLYIDVPIKEFDEIIDQNKTHMLANETLNSSGDMRHPLTRIKGSKGRTYARNLLRTSKNWFFFFCSSLMILISYTRATFWNLRSKTPIKQLRIERPSVMRKCDGLERLKMMNKKEHDEF